MDEMSEGPSPAATIKLRFKEAWELFKAGDEDAAEAMAMELLLEPHLGSYYRAGIHIILTTSSDDSVERGMKTWRRYNDILGRSILSDAGENGINADFYAGKKLLDKARQDQASIDQQIQEKHAGGMAMEEPSQSVPEMAGEWQLSSQRTVPLRTEVNQTDNSRDTIGIDLDDYDVNKSHPDIVKHKPSSGVRKNDQD